MLSRTISGMVGKGSLTHNNRDFCAENVNKNRTKENITYCNENLREVYQQLFGEALERYNAKQKRSDRMIGDYYDHIRTGKQEKLFHEVIFQIGNGKDTPVGSAEGAQAKTALSAFMHEFGERNPHLRVFSAHLHMDEATPHLHIDFVPFTTDSKRGLDTRVSMKKALAAQGFLGGSREETEFNQWINAEKLALSKVMEWQGIQWEQHGTQNEHLSVLDFKKQERTNEVKSLERRLDKLQQKEVDIEAVDEIPVKKVPLSTKVMLEQKDYSNLALAAKKYVAQEKKESKLTRLLDAANKSIAKLKAALTALEKELTSYKSIKGQLNAATLQNENTALRKQNATYQATLKEHGLAPLPDKQRSVGRAKDTAR